MLQSSKAKNKKLAENITTSFLRLRRPGYPLSGCSSALPNSVSPRQIKVTKQFGNLQYMSSLWVPTVHTPCSALDKTREDCSSRRLQAPFLFNLKETLQHPTEKLRKTVNSRMLI